MPSEPLISYAQNGEDVVLWRALGGVHQGCYVDVGGWDPDQDSVTKLFYDRGWRGVNVEPVPEFAEKFRDRRPLDETVQAAITDDGSEHVVLHRFGTTGLSTVDDEFAARHDLAGFERSDIEVPARRLDDVLASARIASDIHFLKIDVEGAEGQVLRSVDLARWRPWVLVIEATEPNSKVTSHEKWEPLVLDAGYTFTLFDGLSRYYVSPDHPELVDELSYPACPLDDYVTEHQHRQDALVDKLTHEVTASRQDALRWRGEAVNYWANSVAHAEASEAQAKRARSEAERLRRQLARVRETLRETRADRKALRARVKRLSLRIEGLRQRQPVSRSLRGGLRAAAGKVRGA